MTARGMSTLHDVRPPAVYWMDGRRLAVVERARAGQDLAAWAHHLREARVDIVVSALELDEASGLGLGSEAAAVRDAGMGFVSLPIRDGGTPEVEAVGVRPHRALAVPGHGSGGGHPLRLWHRSLADARGRAARARRSRCGRRVAGGRARRGPLRSRQRQPVRVGRECRRGPHQPRRDRITPLQPGCPLGMMRDG